MRGKNIMWLALIALLLAMPAVNVRAQSSTVMYVDPPEITGLLPGDTFAVSIMITNVVDLKSWQFEMSYAKYMSEISVVDVIEGDFLMIGGETYMAKNVDPFHGELRVGCTILGGELPGVSGDGWLATVIFTILEAGWCPLDLHDTILLDSMGNEIEHTAVDGVYIGPTADLRKLLGTAQGRKAPYTAPTTVTMKAQVVNTGYAPLDMRLRYTSVHQGTGVTTTLYSGQHLYTTIPRTTEYYYVNSFTADYVGDWSEIGTSPYLGATGDGNYIEGHNHCELIGVFEFADITLNPGDIIYQVVLEGYTQAASSDTDYDVYSPDFGYWYGSLWGSGSYSWKTPRWETRRIDQIDPSVRTVAGFNSFAVVLHHYGTFSSFARLDALRLRVSFIGLDPLTPPVYTIDPYTDPIDLPPAMWDIFAFNAGTYVTTVTLQYLYNYDPRFPQVWLTGDTVLTFTWTVK